MMPLRYTPMRHTPVRCTPMITKHNEQPNPHYGQNAAVLLSRTYVFAAFGGRWPGVAFLIWHTKSGLTDSPLYIRQPHNLTHHPHIHAGGGGEAAPSLSTLFCCL